MNARPVVSWLRAAHEEFTEAPLLAVMLVLSFHSLADGVMRSGYVNDRPLAWLWASGIDYAIWAGYRRIRQGHWEGWLLVVPGSVATVVFQTILAGKPLSWHALVPPGFVVVSLFVMERIRRAKPEQGQSWAETLTEVEGLRGHLGDSPARRRDPAAPGRAALPALQPHGPRAAGRPEGDQRPAAAPAQTGPSARPEAPARTVGAKWTPEDLAAMVRVYETTAGLSRPKRQAVIDQQRVPWAVVEAELKRLGIIRTRAPETNGSSA